MIDFSLPHVAFVTGTEPFDIWNRRSAVGSFLCSVLTNLQEYYWFSVNGVPFQPCPPLEVSEPTKSPLACATRIVRLLPTRLKEALKEPAVFWRQARLSQRLATKPDAPHLVFELYRYGSRVGMKLADRWGCPYVIFCDAPEVMQYQDVHGFSALTGRQARRYEMGSLRRADAIILYSEGIKRRFVQEFGVASSRCHVFQTLDYSRLTEGHFKPNDDALTVGYIGSFMRWHRVSDLVKAFEQIRQLGTRANLLLVGAGQSFDDVVRQVRASRYTQDIEMTGFLYGQALERAKSRIHIGVLPGTMWYNLPTKIFEYGAACAATVAPASPTVLELFTPGETIWSFDEGSVTSLAESLRLLASDRVIRERLAKQLQSLVLQRYKSDCMRKFYRDLFDSLIAGAIQGASKQAIRISS